MGKGEKKSGKVEEGGIHKGWMKRQEEREEEREKGKEEGREGEKGKEEGKQREEWKSELKHSWHRSFSSDSHSCEIKKWKSLENDLCFSSLFRVFIHSNWRMTDCVLHVPQYQR